MKIKFKTKKLRKILNDSVLIKIKYGKTCRKIMIKLSQIEASSSLEELMTLPGRYHKLKGNKKNQFACDLKHPYRLVFAPNNEPLPLDNSGNLIYSEVTNIIINEIVDYH